MTDYVLPASREEKKVQKSFGTAKAILLTH